MPEDFSSRAVPVEAGDKPDFSSRAVDVNGPRLYPGPVTPAINVGGRLFTGPDHVSAYANAKAGGQPDTSGALEGFVDRQGKFLSREQAAAATGLPTRTEPGKLHSSDLPPLLSELRPEMERVAAEWGIQLATPGGEQALTKSDADKLNQALMGMVRDEAMKRLGQGKQGEVVRGLQQAGVGLGESLRDPAMLGTIGASAAAPEVGLPVWAAFLGKAGSQAAGTIAGGGPLQQKIAETAQAAVVALPLAFPKARAGIAEAVQRIATPETGTLAYRLGEAAGRALAPRTTEAVQEGPTEALAGQRPPRFLRPKGTAAMGPSIPRAQQVVGVDPLAGEYRVTEGMTREQIEAAEAAATAQIAQAWPQMSPAEIEAALRGKGIPARFGGRAPNQSSTPGEPSASQISPSTEVHGLVRPQPIQGPRPVPVPPGSPGVQPQAQVGVRQPAPPQTRAEGPRVIGVEPPGEAVTPTPPAQLPPELRAIAERQAQGMDPSPGEQATLAALRTSNPANWHGYYNYLQSLPLPRTAEGGLATRPPEPGRFTEPPATQLMVPGEKPGQLVPYRGQLTQPEPGLAAGIPRELQPPREVPPEQPWMIPQAVYRSRPEAGEVPVNSPFAIDYRAGPETLAQFSEPELRAAAQAMGVPVPEAAGRPELTAAIIRQAALEHRLERASQSSLGAKTIAQLDRLLGDAGLPIPKAKADKVRQLLAYKERLAKDAGLRLANAKHELAVRQALEAGEQVPAAVLRDYPELRREAPAEPPEPPVGEADLVPDRSAAPGDPPAVAAYRSTAGAVAVGPHGLPAGVPTRGPGFVTHLMEATRRLGALARSKFLRPGTLGQFARTIQGDKIYMADVRNQRSMSHESGHALDWLMFQGRGALAHSRESLFTRLIATGNVAPKSKLYSQLADVSELMRGPFDRGAGAYRNRASELIADWFSLYAHDPARARAMAPDWTTGFEKALTAFPEVHETVAQLLAGDVTPIAPALPPGTSGTTVTPQKLPGKLPPRPLLPDIVHEREAATAAEKIVKDAARTLEANIQRARVWLDKMRELVPNATERADVGAFVEGIGNLERAGDDIAAVRLRMTPKMEELARQYRYRTELQRQWINNYLRGTADGEYLRFTEDYLAHFYTDKPRQLSAALGRFLKDSPHAKARKIPTLKEAVDLGLHPVTQDPLVTYELTSRINWRVATNRKAVAALRDLRTTSGDPVIMPKGKAPLGWPTSDNPLIQRVYARPGSSPDTIHLWRGGAAIHPDVWRAVRQLLEAPTTTGAGRFYDAINAATRAAAFAFSGFHDISLRMASMGAASLVRFDNPLRGLGRVLERNPVTGERELFRTTAGVGKDLLKAEDAVADAAQHGLHFSWNDSETYQHAARSMVDRIVAKVREVPVLGKAARFGQRFNDWRQRLLWRNTHDAYKIVAYHDLVSQALQRAKPGTDPSIIKERIAGQLNDAFGGQEWQSQFWLTPEMRRWYSRFLLAPDWTLSTVRSVPLLSDIATAARTTLPRIWRQQPMPGVYEGIQGNLAKARFWGAELMAVATAAIATQWAINRMFGDPNKDDHPWIWENEYDNRYTVDVTPVLRRLSEQGLIQWAQDVPGLSAVVPSQKPGDQVRHYINLGKRAAEVLRWILHPDENIEAKFSRPVAELYKQLTSMEGSFQATWKREEAGSHATFPETLPSRVISVGSNFLPFSFQGRQFVMSVPMRKGMSKFKAEQAFESIYEIAADPIEARRKFRRLLRGMDPADGDLISMAHQVSEAAIRNGVNPEPLRKRALQTVTARYTVPFYKAIQAGPSKPNREKAARLAESMSRLGVKASTIRDSFRRQLQLEAPAPQPSTPRSSDDLVTPPSP